MVAEELPLRLFVAAGLPDETRGALGQVQAGLRDAIGDAVRWVAPDSVHLTLKFLGDVPPDQVQPIADALEQVAHGALPFELELRGAGVFPNERAPSVVWVGLAGDLDALHSLQRGVEEALEALRHPAERRAFNAHLTLGRARDGLPVTTRDALLAALREARPPEAATFTVRRVSLIHSTLTPQGPIYRTLDESDLGGA